MTGSFLISLIKINLSTLSCNIWCIIGVYFKIQQEQASNVAEYKESLINTDKESDLLPVSVIYGPNGGGKTNLLAALPVIILALNEGRLLIVDELDAKLHPMLLRYVIKLFTNKKSNKKGAQLLFTSHDMATMKILFSEGMKYGLLL